MERQATRTFNIPAEATLEVLGGKWKLLILCHLNCGPGPKRTSELKKAIPEITQKMLTQQLRELEEDGIIIRTVYNEVPPKVVYELSELGFSLKSILDQLGEWGEQYIYQREWKFSCSEHSQNA
ncbi:winged helix-turn-helix transcriptional regulator [Paenibacillus oleatilyticus]|uniref:winged helix-turn-helix transcriptional regulator n=1 Tax=Paenibacillus oleatilyticus TaxID=2594886 RepID=UPI001C1F7720|nr:helix-turn-helix domain-containing protein [Paenibacillus oleatilyticus]MBU7318204.1 helix-turn-helix transcriptional regulator [Paenibacillus oleatilyticus]